MKISPSNQLTTLTKLQDENHAGVELIKTIRDRELNTRAVIVSSTDPHQPSKTEKTFVMECLDAGAAGYIPKGMNDDDQVFRRALETILAGGTFLPVSVFGRGGTEPPSLPSEALVPAESLGLTPRQLEVLWFMAQGDMYKTIAERLNLKEATVRRDYGSKLLEIFQCESRSKLIVELARRKIVIPRPASATGSSKAPRRRASPS